MWKPEEKGKAVSLRKQGLSYREILQHVPVAKSTLSLWLRSVGLSRPQKQRLTEKKLAAARRGWEKVHAERLARMRQVVAEAEDEARRRIAKGDRLWIVGTALYWAEGAKPKDWRAGEMVMLSNTDLRMIILMREWLRRCCSVSESDIRYAVYIHERADIAAALRFWANGLGLPVGHLRTYLKKHNPSPRRKNTGNGYRGTMRMAVRRSTMLNHRIAGWIRGLAKHCGVG